MKEFLQGKPLRHPLHPVLVHFPISLFVLSFFLDVASFIRPDFDGLVRGAFYCMVAGLIGGVLAAIPGFVDYSDIRSDHPAKKFASTHMVINLVMLAAYGLNIGLRFSDLDVARTPQIPFVLSIIGIGLLSISGYIGGYMVYDDGIGVGRHRRRTRTPEKTLKPVARDEWVEVTDASALQNNETLRVQVDGVVMTVAKVEGEFFAVQEFCTHRCGPLSEGSIHDRQIQCPWHRSCFDLRTGKVTHGPAKVDLKTFPVEVRDRKVFVAKPRREEKPELIVPRKSLRSRFRFGKLQRRS